MLTFVVELRKKVEEKGCRKEIKGKKYKQLICENRGK